MSQCSPSTMPGLLRRGPACCAKAPAWTHPRAAGIPALATDRSRDRVAQWAALTASAVGRRSSPRRPARGADSVHSCRGVWPARLGTQGGPSAGTERDAPAPRLPTARQHRSPLAAVEDIAQGAQALSEIDFVRLCRRFALPAPRQQTVHPDRHGHRRYIDATWRRCDGRLVAVEVDGALHLAVSRWWADQLRQNELSLSDVVVLRYPSVVVREEPALVAAQLRRALLL
jgi:hypothetical protein